MDGEGICAGEYMVETKGINCMSDNILILSCGTRDLLVRYFKRADYERVIGADCSELAPALYEADKYLSLIHISEPTRH